MTKRHMEDHRADREGDGVHAQAAFWNTVVRSGIPRFRWLRRSLRSEQMDQKFAGTALEYEWSVLKGQLLPGDKIWPFTIHVRSYLGLREGIVVMRGNKAIGGIVTTSS